MNLYDAIFEMAGIEPTDEFLLILKTMVARNGAFTVEDLLAEEALRHMARETVLDVACLFEKKGIIYTLESLADGRDPYLIAYQNY